MPATKLPVMPTMHLCPGSASAKLIIPTLCPSCRNAANKSLFYLKPSLYRPLSCCDFCTVKMTESQSAGCRQVRFQLLVFGLGFGFSFGFWRALLVFRFRHSWATMSKALSLLTHRHKAAGAVGSSNRGGRVAHESLQGIRGHEVAEDHEESQDEFHTETLPGGQGSALGDGSLQIALVTRHSDAVKGNVINI